MMPFGIRRFTLQRSFSTESGGGGSKLPKSKSHDAAGGHGNVHGSATHGGSTVGGTGTLLSASRSVDQADLRRLGDPPGYSSQSGGGAGVRQGQGGGGVNHQNSAVNSGASQSLAAIQPPRLPPRGPPRRSASVDQANPPSQGLLSRWRSSGKSRSIEGGGSSRGMHGKRTPSTTMDFTGGLPFNDEDDSELDLLPTSQRPQKHHLAQVSRPTDQSYTQMRRQRFQESGECSLPEEPLQTDSPARMYYISDRNREQNVQQAGSMESGASSGVDSRRGPQSRGVLSRHGGENQNTNGSSGGSRGGQVQQINSDQPKSERQSSSAGGGPVISMMDRGGVGAQMNPMASIGSHGMPGLMQQPPMYQPPAALYDDDPGIMSEVETSATGLRRGAKARSSLPIVRTPNKTNERPLDPSEFAGGIYAYNEYGSAMMMSLGLVFLQYRNETRRALLPNEITSMDTVKALFVRSFPRQLSMEYLDSAIIRIYIHDPGRDMFYELEDLRDVRDRSVLRIYEHDPQSGAPIMFAPTPLPMHPGGIPAQHGLLPEDLSYFSEPEFDSDYPNSHSMHRQQQQAPRGTQQLPCPPPKGSSYYGIPMYANRSGGGPQPPMRPYSPAASERAMRTTGPTMGPPGAPPGQVGFSQTLPRGMTYSAVGVPMGLPDDKRQQQPFHIVPMSQSHHDLTNPKAAGLLPPKPARLAGFVSQGVSPLGSPHSPQSPPLRQLPTGRGYSHEMVPRSRTPEGYLSSPERSSRMMYPESDQFFDPRLAQGPPSAPLVDEEARLRVEYMERQLASLTGLVHKALAPTSPNPALQAPNGVLQASHAGANPASRPQHLIPTRDTDKDGSSPSSTLNMPISKPRQSFKEEKSVSFCEEPLTSSSHSPSAQANRPMRPALKGFRSYSVSDGDFDPSRLPPALPDKESRLNKPPPPPKPAASAFSHSNNGTDVGVPLAPETCAQLRQLRRHTKELRAEVRNLRRMAQAQAAATKEAVKDTCAKINEAIVRVKISQEKEDREKEKEKEELLQGSGDAGAAARERIRISRQEGSYNADAQTLEKDLAELETQVEELRSNVINRRCRVNMSNVESMALVLSKASRTVADLKNRFPALQETMKAVISGEMETVVREEKFLKEEPERLENALRRCKKLTGTLVTLKRLASVQEQRHTSLPEKSVSADGPGPHSHNSHSDGEPTQASQSRSSAGPGGLSGLSVGPGAPSTTRERRRSENALDALLDELQTFSPRTTESPSKSFGNLLCHCDRFVSVEAMINSGSVSSSNSGLNGDNRSKSASTLPLGASVGAPVGNSSSSSSSSNNSGVSSNVGAKKTPPPPPPRTTSKSPVQSPTGAGASSTSTTSTMNNSSNNNKCNGNNNNNNNNNNNSCNNTQQQQQQQQQQQTARRCQSEPPSIRKISEQNSSGSSESVNSQDGTQNRQELLEQRHQELLKKQKLLQEQYARLQLLQKLSPPKPDLKKTGSESNILHKASDHGASGICASHTSGSLTSLAASPGGSVSTKITSSPSQPQLATSTLRNKIYETDIL
ncbi:coiled-coil domain-containing protein AGAP005037-like isoform X5 [Varroa destructor]|uniref:Actin interacting protein 3-like C-terminal domain-containing protein n=3 Tax=Varroa destructor TaxID=109461 RepID=A0A7M7JWV9_VARDE|nr:coiled-coil domain-containing protein AGAP005037-like isoform X5 [Varroa destructor]XP_022658346.1 coiled-coil domain-containing protein AGAP005037-like isoform X5 [Varroa destructor]XP_022658347.1 coiled-coil domain-containing protein AGAP005037-like isoform X5 [Varroa destructor]XP_022658348.1 coiled-coil domain-containing protein AGAP005037-like isoform X5 [Varroa destructor]